MRRAILTLAALALAAGLGGAQGRFRAPVIETALNTPQNDYQPTLTQDALTMWFTSDRVGGAGLMDVWVTQRPDIASFWSVPQTEPVLNTSYGEHYIAVTPDGQEMFIATDRPGGLGGHDLWVATRSGPGWNAPVHVPELNSSASVDDDPAVRGDGLEIFFTSNRAPSQGGAAIWRATRPSIGGTWNTPVIVAELDTSSAEHSPAVSDDGLTLFFSSNRAGGVGSSDFWVTRRPDLNSPFGAAVNVAEINSVQWDFNGDLTSDEFTFYFSSYPGGVTTGDILRADGIHPRVYAFDLPPRVGQPFSIWCRRDPGDVGGLALSAVQTAPVPIPGVIGGLELGFPLLVFPPGVCDTMGRVTVPLGPIPPAPGVTVYWQAYAQDGVGQIYLGPSLATTIVP